MSSWGEAGVPLSDRDTPRNAGSYRTTHRTNSRRQEIRSRPRQCCALPGPNLSDGATSGSAALGATVVDRGGPGCLNVLAMLFACTAIKIAVVGVMTRLRWLSVVADRSNHVDRDTAVAP